MSRNAFDPEAEAAEIFGLSSEMCAVIVATELVVTRKRGRSKHLRKLKKVSDAANRAVLAGDLSGARRLIEEASWPGPPLVWWVESQSALAVRLAEINDVVEGVFGVESGLLTPQVAFYDIFPD